MVLVLVVVNPGCDAKTQEDVAGLAWDLLDPHGHEEVRWWGGHHHVFGRVDPSGHFSRVRLVSDFDDDDLPTVRPISHPPSYPDGNTCLGCNGTGRIPFACALNTCPLCGGAGFQVDDNLEPGIFPLWLMDPGFDPWAIVTPDGRWHSSNRPDWERRVREIASYFRHCYGRAGYSVILLSGFSPFSRPCARTAVVQKFLGASIDFTRKTAQSGTQRGRLMSFPAGRDLGESHLLAIHRVCIQGEVP